MWPWERRFLSRIFNQLIYFLYLCLASQEITKTEKQQQQQQQQQQRQQQQSLKRLYVCNSLI